MTTEAVLFDLDGTLVDSLPLIFRTYRQVFADMGIPWNESDVEKMIGLPLKDIGKHFTGRDESRFEELYQSYYHRIMIFLPGFIPAHCRCCKILRNTKSSWGL